MPENESGTTLCTLCGDIAHFNVMVTNPYVSGQWCRTACRRPCAEQLSRLGVEELERCGGLRDHCKVEVSFIKTAAA